MERKFVVCIEGTEFRGLELVEGQIYKVLDSSNCPDCGELRFNVGIISGVGSHCACGHSQSSPIWLFRATRFRDIDMNFGKEKCESIERQPVKQLA